jgi:hypothetical protein
MTKSESSTADSKPGTLMQSASGQPGTFMMTKELKQLALTSWKNLLVSTGDYAPLQTKAVRTHENSIKLLRRAISHWKENKPAGVQCISWDHDYFRAAQRTYYIPQTYCDPEVYFQNLKKDPSFAYYNRPCSMKVYYELLCADTPGYTKRQKPPRKYTAPIAHNPGFRRSNDPTPEYDEEEALTRWRQGRPNNQRNESSSVENDTTKLSDSQKWAAEQTQLRRQKALIDKRSAPIPEDDDTSGDTETDDNVFDEHLLPMDKMRIKTLMENHKRIRSKVYSKAYLEARDRDITAAEKERLEGGNGPLYLSGCKTPWSSGMGHAPQRYDDFQKGRIIDQIAQIKKNNAELCLTHYTANKFNKGGPGGQVQL